jgi:hypothetical protein
LITDISGSIRFRVPVAGGLIAGDGAGMKDQKNEYSLSVNETFGRPREGKLKS